MQCKCGRKYDEQNDTNRTDTVTSLKQHLKDNNQLLILGTLRKTDLVSVFKLNDKCSTSLIYSCDEDLRSILICVIFRINYNLLNIELLIHIFGKKNIIFGEEMTGKCAIVVGMKNPLGDLELPIEKPSFIFYTTESPYNV